MIMKKYHITNAEYNVDTGFSLIEISTSIGSFFGYACLNPEDRKAGYDSRFFGCQLAELRAVIKYYKALVRIEKEVYKREINFLNTLRQAKEYDDDAFYAKRLKKKCRITENEKNNLIRDLKALQEKEKRMPYARIESIKESRAALQKRRDRENKMNKLREGIRRNLENQAAKKRKSRIAATLSDTMDKNN